MQNDNLPPDDLEYEPSDEFLKRTFKELEDMLRLIGCNPVIMRLTPNTSNNPNSGCKINEPEEMDPVTGKPKTKVQKEHEKNNSRDKYILQDDITNLSIKLDSINTIDELIGII